MTSNFREQLTTVETAGKLGLLPEEYDKIKNILGRIPNFTELSVFSVMWSEHCSYKNSIKWLKTLPKKGPHMLAEAGEENAGLVDIGDGIGCAFKIESHNHPSAIEPYQGAATGVGGINRDIFTMGARPICQLNSLRFGNLKNDKTKWLIKGVVKGIGDYGNSFGVPVVAGEIYFDSCYQDNPLVNAMSVGILDSKKTISAISYGEGNPVFIVGSMTGKDGIHGATFASGDITEESSKNLPSVQVGDPFQEKLLLEASLEIADTDAIIGMQDMGAAGIACSTSEMSAKGEHGMIVHLDKVPLRQQDMVPFEILLSESQERMLVVVKKGKESVVKQIFDKWDLQCVQIGEVTKDKNLKYFWHGELVAEIPAECLVLGGGAPVYDREYSEPPYYAETKKFNIDSIKEPSNYIDIAKYLIANPNIASKKWIYEQYDSMVQTNNMSTNNPTDAAVVNIKNTNKAILVTVDCNSKYIYADPEIGAQIAVSESARNIVCSGGIPSAITNCLNFGNPYNPHVYWQFVNVIKGMSKACLKYETPVTGGNVSFYNQSVKNNSIEAVYPTPVIGMLGLMENKENVMSLNFKGKGDLIYLIGESKNDISSSVYLAEYHNVKLSQAPYFNLDEEANIHNSIIQLIEKKLISSAHDVSEGGLFVTLVESCFKNKFGLDVTTDAEIRKDAFLFGEAQGRIVVSVMEIMEDAFIDFIQKIGAKHTLLGHVTKGDIRIDDESYGTINEYKSLYDNAIENIINE